MTKTTAIAKTPSPTGGEPRTRAANSQGANPKAEFMAAALNMSWQLAIVVLVPILGGFALDNKFNTAPLLIIIGFILAMAGMGAVVWRQLQIFSPGTLSKGHHS